MKLFQTEAEYDVTYYFIHSFAHSDSFCDGEERNFIIPLTL